MYTTVLYSCQKKRAKEEEEEATDLGIKKGTINRACSAKKGATRNKSVVLDACVSTPVFYAVKNPYPYMDVAEMLVKPKTPRQCMVGRKRPSPGDMR
jgi:hypothetical protein